MFTDLVDEPSMPSVNMCSVDQRLGV